MRHPLPPPPLAPRKPHVQTLHGEQRQDDYAWLRTHDSPEVEAWLTREEEYARDVLAPLEPLRLRLHEEMLARHREDATLPPARKGGFLYYSREPKGRSRPLHCRRRDEPGAPEEVLLDENALAADNPAFRLGTFALAPDQRLLLFGVDATGEERLTLRVKELETGRLLEDEVVGASDCVAWAADGRSFFYVALDGSLRPDRLFHHVIGTPASEDVLVFREEDEAFRLCVGNTESEAFVKLVSASKTTSEVHLLPASPPHAPARRVAPRRPGVFHDVTHSGDWLYLLTNDEAPNSRVLVAPARGDGPWRELVPHREHVLLCRLQAFAHHLVLHVRQQGFRQLEVVDLRRQPELQLHPVALPDLVHDLSPADNLEFHTSTVRFGYSSPVSPDSLFDYDMDSRQLTRVEQLSVPGYSPWDYEVTRLMATARDGEQVPLSVVHHRRIRLDNRNPVVLYGYGAYGLSMDPGFSAELPSLLDEGVVFAIAHVRGGSELGRHWHEQGRLLNKRNSVLDFLSCARHLVSAGYTAPGLIAAMGESAGGTLVGAAVNLCPELFGAVLAEVPFVDVVDTLLDETQPLTPTEWEEWGDPREPEHYRNLRALSPYDNVDRAPYPAMLVTAALHDSRVPFWEPVRWVARLRASTTSSHPVVLHLMRHAGHAGANGRHERLQETALRYAFLLEQLRSRQP